MILLTNLTEQTLQPGQSLTFSTPALLHTGCGECFNQQFPQSVKLRRNGVYDVSFGANIGGETAATPVQIALTLGGYPLAETTMISTPAATTDRNSVSRRTLIKNSCGDYDHLAVTNTGTVPVIIGAGSSLVIVPQS